MSNDSKLESSLCLRSALRLRSIRRQLFLLLLLLELVADVGQRRIPVYERSELGQVLGLLVHLIDNAGQIGVPVGDEEGGLLLYSIGLGICRVIKSWKLDSQSAGKITNDLR